MAKRWGKLRGRPNTSASDVRADSVLEDPGRAPPADVKEQLRREVNFGCPVEDCGAPYLTWHHFDPPWSREHHHRPEGMIALCSTHAAQADGDRWTNEQLRGLKAHPFVTTESITEFYGYLRRNVVCRLGSIITADVVYVLNSNRGPVVYFRKDGDGYDRLNLAISSPSGSPILKMEDNWWTVNPRNLFDLECSARGRTLHIRSNDGSTDFTMRFDDLQIDQFSTELEQAGFSKRATDLLLKEIESPATVPVWSLTGSLFTGGINVRMTPGITYVGSTVIHNGLSIKCETGLMIS